MWPLEILLHIEILYITLYLINALTFKHFDCSIANPPRVFEMVITPDLEYPIVCVNVRKGFDGKSLKLDMVNLNSTASWFQSDASTDFGLETGSNAGPMDGYATVIPRHELMNVQAVVQLEKDTILVCYDSKFSSFICNHFSCGTIFGRAKLNFKTFNISF